MTYTSDKRLYLDENGKVVEEIQGSGSLLVGEGGELPDEVAEKYGLTNTKAVAEPAENKARQAAPENKSSK